MRVHIKRVWRFLSLLLFAIHQPVLPSASTSTNIQPGKYFSDRTYLSVISPVLDIQLDSVGAAYGEKFLVGDADTRIDVTAGYQRSYNEEDLGRYFGSIRRLFGPLSEQLPDNYIAVGANRRSLDDYNYSVHLFNWDLIHDAIAVTNLGSDTLLNSPLLEGSVYMNPYEERYFGRISIERFFGDRDSVRWFFRAGVPFGSIKRSLNFSTGEKLESQRLTISDTLFSGPEVTLLDFLTGGVRNTYSKNKQAPLKRLKFHNGRTTSAFMDALLSVGAYISTKKRKWLRIGVHVVVPMGGKPSGEYLFEPIGGNGGHWGFGGFFDGSLRLWRNTEDSETRLLFGLTLTHMLEGSEFRVPIFASPRTSSLYPHPQSYSQYRLIIPASIPGATAEPAANLIGTEVNVAPGAVINGMLALHSRSGYLSGQLDYSFRAKRGETVSFRLPPQSSYVVPSWDADFGATVFTETSQYTVNFISSNDYLLWGCQTPAQVVHRLSGSVSVSFDDLGVPAIISSGGYYEFGMANSAPAYWSLWIKGTVALQ